MAAVLFIPGSLLGTICAVFAYFAMGTGFATAFGIYMVVSLLFVATILGLSLIRRTPRGAIQMRNVPRTA